MRTNQLTLRITHLIGEWINIYLPSQNIRSEKTARNYEYAISLFLDFLEKDKRVDSLSIVPDDFCPQNMEEWIKWLTNNRNCCPATCNNRLGALRTFLKYVARTDHSLAYLYHEAQAIPLQKVLKKAVTGVSKKGLKSLLSVPDQRTSTGRKYLTLFTVMYNIASRLDEILSLTIRDLHIDVSSAYVTVIGKGSKIRTLYLLPRTVTLLRKYLKEFHGSFPAPVSYVFYSRNIGPRGKISQVAVNKQLKKYAMKAHETCTEVPVSLHCHQIRHSAATHWLDNGMNIVQISTILGHSNIQTTMVYFDINLEMKKKAIEKIEDETISKIPKKWKFQNSLSVSCGIKPIITKSS